MGGSLRRSKKTRPKMTIRTKRKTKTKSRMPADLKTSAAEDQARLGLSNWDDQQTYAHNYQLANIVADANAAFGRNFKPDALKDRAAEMQNTEEDIESADVKEVLHKPGSGKRPVLTKLTANQLIIVQQLLEAHGDDVEAMVWDTKLNKMLLPASKLKLMIQSYKEVGEKGRCGFRVPRNRLW